MRKRKLLAIGLAAICVLSACGNGEDGTWERTDAREKNGTREGTDAREGSSGYVYVPETIDVPLDSENSFLDAVKAMDEYLYYKAEVTTASGMSETQISRIPLQDELDFNAGELVFRSGQPYVDYTVDQAQDLYVCTGSFGGDLILSKLSEDGENIYQLTLTGEPYPTSRIANGSIIATDGSGTIYVLSQQSLLQIGPEGTLTGKFSLETDSSYGISGYLLEDSAGHVYYWDSSLTLESKLSEISGTGSLQLKEISAVSSLDNPFFYHGRDGLLLLSGGCLYQYQTGSDTVEKILSLEDCDIYESSVKMAMPLPDGDFLIYANEGSGYDPYHNELLRLARTAAARTPKRQRISS
ncbi:MAG TPA: hypothetical protein DCZ91_00230 [Lachnospiraceae bacterium]|nr:hypothetical protein [Lachnospiraceae bacterium]